MRAGWRPGWAHSTLSTSYRHGEYFAENTYFLSIIVSLNCKIFNRESRTRAAEGSRMPGEASRQCRYTRPGHHFGIQLARSFFTLHATKFSFCLEYQEKSLIYLMQCTTQRRSDLLLFCLVILDKTEILHSK